MKNEWKTKIYGCLEENVWTYGPSETKTNMFWHVLKENREKEESKVHSKHFWVTQRSVQRSHLDSLLKPLVKSQRHVIFLLQTSHHWIHLGADGIYVNIQLIHLSKELLHAAGHTKTCGSKRVVPGWDSNAWRWIEFSLKKWKLIKSTKTVLCPIKYQLVKSSQNLDENNSSLLLWSWPESRECKQTSTCMMHKPNSLETDSFQDLR